MKHIVEQHEESFQGEYTDGIVWLVKLFGFAGIGCAALLITHIAFTHFVSPAYDTMTRDPMEVVE